MSDRSRRTTFNDAADSYAAVRPGYPDAVFDNIAGVCPAGQVLEIGCGTGQATRALAERGYRVDAIELGDALAARARAHVADYDTVSIRVEDFETCSLAGGYDLVASFSAFHWIDPAVGYRRCADALREGGHLALVWHLHPGAVWPFAQDIQKIYEERYPGARDGEYPTLDERVAKRSRAIADSGLFAAPEVSLVPWELNLNSADYLRLLNTFSDHRTLAPAVREALFAEIEALIDGQYGGVANRRYVTAVFLAELAKPAAADV